MSRMTTNSSAINALEAVNVSINDIEGNVRPVSAIIEELATKWDSLSDRERQLTAVRVAGTQQLTRFSALMNNYSMAIDATTSSLDSQGSAMREQEKYNQSLEARMNRLQTSVWSLAGALGDSIIYDSIVAITGILESMTSKAEDGVNNLNVLPVVFGLIGAGILTVSTRLQGLTGSIIANMTATKASIVADGVKATALRTVAGAATMAGTALKSLGIVLGISMAAGYALEFLIKKYSDSKQKQEEMTTAQEKNISALTENKSRVEELISSYNSLSKSADAGTLDSSGMQKYLDVQTELGELFPSLISHIDATGQAHLVSSKAVAEEVKWTNELIKAKKEEQQVSAYRTIQETMDEIEGSEGEIQKLEKAIANLQENIRKGENGNILFGDTQALTETLARTKTELRSLQLEASKNSQKIVGAVNTISEAFLDIEIDPKIKKELNDLVFSLDFTKMDTSQLESFAIKLADITTGLQKAYASGDSESFDSLNNDLSNLFSTTNDFVPKANSLHIEFDKIAQAADTSAVSLASMDGSFEDSFMSASELEEKIAKLADSMYDLKSAEEQLTGTSYNHVKSSEELIFMYDTLTSRLNGLSDQELQAILSKQNLSNEEKFLVQAMQQRGDIITQLSVLYPQFAKLQEGQISLSSEQVKAMKSEQEANKVLLESYKLASEGKLNSEQAMTLAQATATKARIDNIKKEIEALNILNQELQKYINNSKSATDDEGRGSMRASMIQATNLQSIGNRTSELEGLQSQLTTSVGSLKAINTAINDTSKKSSKASEKANKETTKSLKESIYVSDKYKQALEKINLEIEKQQNLQSKFAPHSEEYRKSLLAQIKLEKEKLSLFKSQSSELQKQIKSGKIAQTGIVDVTPATTTKTTTASKKLNGWSGSTTSGFGMRMHPTLGVYKMHEGIDIAGKKGTRLDSNVNGKVVSQGYNSVSGNFVKIQDSNGFKHFYAHLDKAFVKLGDMVEAGTHIGNIGSTGRSTGSHLHYGVQNKSGKYINPADYVKSAKNNKVVTSTTTSSNEKSASTIRAEAQQALDQAKSDFNTLQQNILAQQKVIEDLEKTKLIESNLAWFDYKRNQYDDSITFESTKIEELDTNSKRYNATLENMIKFMNKKQSMNQQELKYLQSSINNGQYQGEVLDNLKERYSALTTEMKATQIEIKKTNYEILMNIKTQSDELISDVEYQMSRAKAIQGMYEEGSGDWVELAEEEIALQKELTKLYKQQYDQLQKEMTARSLNASEIKSMNAELQNLSVAYWNALSAEKAMTKSLEDSQKAILSNMADDIISSYKDVYSEKQDIHMESLESERRAEEKAHQARMKQIEDEMKLYRKSVQEKIDLINKQESERDYNMEVSDMEAERSSVAKKLNEVQFDNSHEGKAERKKLQEQLDKIDKDIAEKRHDRDIDLQTTALNEMLELKEEESQGVQEIETARYDTVISNIDRQKEYWGKYYNDIINDERKFAKLREDIMNKNFDNIEKEFGEFINELNSSLPSLEDTMDGTMGAVGTSIRVNIIDNLKRALEMLAEFESKQAVTNSHSTMGSGSVSSPTGSGKSTLSNGDLQVLLGKFMTESLANEETNASRKATIKNKAYEIASSGRSAGSSIGSSESLNSVVSRLSKEDLATLSAYISSRAGSIVSTPALQDYIRNFAKQLLSSSASLSVGGMIPRATGGIDGKGGRSVIVHPDEIISNPIDSKNMVIASSIMERITSMLSLPKLNSLISPSNGGNGVEINFNIDKMYGTEQEANGILSKINTTMKTRFGGGL